MQTNNLNVTPNGVMPRVNVSQYDNEREVHFLLFDGSSSYTPPTGAEIRVEGTKKDGNGFSYECTYSGNNVTVTIKSQMTVFAGDVLCELRISKGDLDIGTLNFILGVEEGALASDVPISDTEIPAIIELAKGEQFNAEAWAQGTKDGVPVTSSDPQYHNNAKWWAEHSQGGSFANLSDVSLDNLQNGQVPVYNSTTEKWENGAGSAGLLPHLYIDSEPESTVTVIAPDSSVITPTQISSGHWECDVPDYGVYVIHAVIGADDATFTLTVDDVKEYHITDNHYDYTLSVYAPNGSVIRVTDGVNETYTGTGAGSTAEVFALHQASTTYTIQVTIDGVSKSDSVTTPETTGGSGSKTFEYGTINVTLDADFIGETITCVNGGTTISKTASTTSLVFYPPTTGTWAISGEVSGTTYSVNAEVTSLSTPVSVSLQVSITVTVTMYGAAGAVISYTDANGSQTQTLDNTGKKENVSITVEPNSATIVFTDTTVAKDPSNLSNNYTKSVTITSGMTEIYVMPDDVKIFYWYGYEPNAMTAIASGATDMAQTAPTITNNTTSKSVSQTNTSRGCGYYQTSSEGTELHIIYSASSGQAYAYNSIYASMSNTNNKTETGVANIELLRNSASVSTTHKQATITNKNYVIIQLTADNASVSLTLKALWLA